MRIGELRVVALSRELLVHVLNDIGRCAPEIAAAALGLLSGWHALKAEVEVADSTS